MASEFHNRVKDQAKPKPAADEPLPAPDDMLQKRRSKLKNILGDLQQDASVPMFSSGARSEMDPTSTDGPSV